MLNFDSLADDPILHKDRVLFSPSIQPLFKKIATLLDIPWTSIYANDPLNPTLGIEIEAENIDPDASWEPLHGIWIQKEDGSLRKGGREYITIPLQFSALLKAFQLLATSIPEAKFTHRCSTHVHIDVRHMTRSQMVTFILLYALCEPLLFAFAGKFRRHNNFCVGIEYTNDLNEMLLTAHHGRIASDNLQKYAALNILPAYVSGQDVTRYGTFEFRHLFGTLNAITLMDWCSLILRLRMAAIEIDLSWLIQKTRYLNVDSSYSILLEKIFKDSLSIFWNYVSINDLPRLLEKHVSRVKQSVLHHEFSRKLSDTLPEENSQYLKGLKRMYPHAFKSKITLLPPDPLCVTSTEADLALLHYTWSSTLIETAPLAQEPTEDST